MLSSHVKREIATQPEVWVDRRVAEQALRLPGPSGWVGVVGCGTSLYMAQSYAAYREGKGLGRTDAFPASLAPQREWDYLLAISRSGTTTEVLDLLSQSKASVKIALTASENDSLLALADEVLVMPFVDEESVVQTRFATTALVTLLTSIGYNVQEAIEDTAAGFGTNPDSQIWSKTRQFVFIGVDWTYGIANEAALKLREMAGQWSESYPAMEYRHGPISVADESTLVWGFGLRDEALIEQIRVTGAHVYWPKCDPLASLVAVQRLGLALAEKNGWNPDTPRYLTRSVILNSSNHA